MATRRSVPCVSAVALFAAGVPLAAQTAIAPASRTPAVRDLSGASPIPFMTGQARVQQFYEASEVGTSQRTVRRFALRWDGPSQGVKKSHTIAELTVRIGATAKGVGALDSLMDGNLTAPLATVIQKQRLDYQTDGIASTRPEAFGGADGKLVFAFSRPVVVTIPRNGCMAVEIVVRGNTNTSAMAQLDFSIDPANMTRMGLSVPNGKGCPAGPSAAGATLETSGRYEPGGSISLHGTGYSPRVPVLTLLTLRLLASKLAFPATSPICWLYVAPSTGFGAGLLTASASGTIEAFDPGTMIPLPKEPPLCGAVLYVQNVSPTPPWEGNKVGVMSSNYRTIVIGCKKQPTVRAWHASNHARADAQVASLALYGGFAMRID